MSGNQALNINTNSVNGVGALGTNYAISTNASDWYFAVCAIMTVSTFAFVGLGQMKHRSQRLFFYVTASITMVAAIAYFTMGANLGYVGIGQYYIFNDAQTVREIYYVRYIDWVITTPLLLTDLLLTAGLPAPTILFVILVDEVMIITGLVGALIVTSYKWAYFTFGCVALFYVVYVLVFEARVAANKLGKDIGRVFLMTGSWTALLWCLYPIAWGLCEGSGYLSPSQESIFYGILDVCAKPIFGAILLIGHKGISMERLGIHIRDYEDNDYSVRNSEKKAEAAHSAHGGVTEGTNGTTNGTTTTQTV